MALRHQSPARAVARLKQLSEQASAAERKFAGSAQAIDSLNIAASLLSEAGQHRRAAHLLRQVAWLHESSYRRHGYGLASALGGAALELFRSGSAKPSASLAEQALRHFGDFPDPSAIHEELVRRLRHYQQERAGKPKRTGTSRGKRKPR